MSITFKRFSYLSERANQLDRLVAALKEAGEMNDHVQVYELQKKIVFESQFFAAYVHSLLVEVHIQQATSRDI